MGDYFIARYVLLCPVYEFSTLSSQLVCFRGTPADVEEFYLQCDPGEGFTLSSEKVCPKDDFTVTFVTGLESHCVCIVIALTVVRFASIHKMIENWPY